MTFVDGMYLYTKMIMTEVVECTVADLDHNSWRKDVLEGHEKEK
jgi:hypothetical protein